MKAFAFTGGQGDIPLASRNRIAVRQELYCGFGDMWEHIQCLLFLCKSPVGDLRVLAA